MAEEFEYISRDNLPVLRDRVSPAGDIARVCVTQVDEDGNPIVVSGGGVQYTEGDTDASITGTAIMWEDAGDTLEPVSASSPLPVNVVAGGTSGHQDDTAFTPGTTQGSIIMAHADEAAPDSVDEGDAGALRMTLPRALHTNLRDSAGTEVGTVAAPVRVDPTGTTTQPISAVSLPLPTGASTSALQLPDGHNVTVDNAAGGAAVNIQDGGNSITVDGSVTAIAQPGVDIGDVTVNNAAGAAAVNIQDGGNSITVDALALPLPTGAATEVTLAVHTAKFPVAATPGDNFAAPSATQVYAHLMMFDSANWDRVPGTTATGLLVNTELPGAIALSDTYANQTAPQVGAASMMWNGASWTRSVSGAGAVGAGVQRVTHASDDPVTTAVQIMDDWDESDRAKVNLIAGQAGVQGGSGAVSANTQRVVLATDVGPPYYTLGALEVASPAYYTAAGTTLTTSFVEKATTFAAVRGIGVVNTTDRDVELALDGGTNPILNVGSGHSAFFDFAAMGLNNAGSTLDVRSMDSAPTVGRITVMGLKLD